MRACVRRVGRLYLLFWLCSSRFFCLIFRFFGIMLQGVVYIGVVYADVWLWKFLAFFFLVIFVDFVGCSLSEFCVVTIVIGVYSLTLPSLG